MACARKLKVQIDGIRVAKIKAKETLTLELPPGVHEVRLTLDRFSSPPLRLAASDGETIQLTGMVPAPVSLQGAWDAMFGPFFWPKRYLILYRTDGLQHQDPALPQPSNYPRPR